MNEPLDLTIALRKLHELAQEEGDLGYAYWYAVAKLLKETQRLAERVRDLECELSRQRASQPGDRRRRALP